MIKTHRFYVLAYENVVIKPNLGLYHTGLQMLERRAFALNRMHASSNPCPQQQT